jgi:regulator of protease activity HflC (stomatin/prohibitin superfamily)
VTTALVVVAVVVVLGLILLSLSVRVVREYQRLVVFRLGRVIGLRNPGVRVLIPLVDRPMTVDLREFYLEVPHQTSFTKDNAAISIDFITFFKVIDPVASVVQVQNFAGAATNISATTLRSVIGDIMLDDVLAKRDEINETLRAKLDEITERWGVKVTNVEIREIIPPPAVQEAMTRQMSAERTRRAAVTEAEGDKAAAILRAEGDKQSNILTAEGNKQAVILEAEGDKQAAALRAEGFALALTTLNASAREADPRTMGLQYLDALKALGATEATKLVVPVELTGLLQGMAAYAGLAFADGRTAAEALPAAEATAETTGDDAGGGSGAGGASGRG